MSEFVTHDKSFKSLPNTSVNMRTYDKNLDYEELIFPNTLLDEGSQLSYISARVVESFGIRTQLMTDPMRINNATGQLMATCSRIV